MLWISQARENWRRNTVLDFCVRFLFEDLDHDVVAWLVLCGKIEPGEENTRDTRGTDPLVCPGIDIEVQRVMRDDGFGEPRPSEAGFVAAVFRRKYERDVGFAETVDAACVNASGLRVPGEF